MHLSGTTRSIYRYLEIRARTLVGWKGCVVILPDLDSAPASETVISAYHHLRQSIVTAALLDLAIGTALH